MPSTPVLTLIFKPIWENGTCTFEVFYPNAVSFDRIK